MLILSGTGSGKSTLLRENPDLDVYDVDKLISHLIGWPEGHRWWENISKEDLDDFLDEVVDMLIDLRGAHILCGLGFNDENVKALLDADVPIVCVDITESDLERNAKARVDEGNDAQPNSVEDLVAARNWNLQIAEKFSLPVMNGLEWILDWGSANYMFPVECSENSSGSIRSAYNYNGNLVIVKVFSPDSAADFSVKLYQDADRFEKVKSYWTTVRTVAPETAELEYWFAKGSSLFWEHLGMFNHIATRPAGSTNGKSVVLEQKHWRNPSAVTQLMERTAQKFEEIRESDHQNSAFFYDKLLEEVAESVHGLPSQSDNRLTLEFESRYKETISVALTALHYLKEESGLTYDIVLWQLGQAYEQQFRKWEAKLK